MNTAMRFLSVTICLLSMVLNSCKLEAQKISSKPLNSLNIKLPPALEDPNQQFSGLYIANNKLYLLPECRLQEDQEAALYAIDLAIMDKAITGDSSPVAFEKIPITGLQYLRGKMKDANQVYEGTEAMIINGCSVYISVETNTPSPYGYLLKGKLQGRQIVMDTTLLYAIKKPVTEEGKRIYNASFEAIQLRDNKLWCFFEYNSFSRGSFVYVIDSSLQNASVDSVKLPAIPFRITDITSTGKNTAAAINFFYKGEGEDEVYRPDKNSEGFNLVYDSAGFKSYSRLISLHFISDEITYDVIGELPTKYWPYNWEGIAAYKNGFFIINDKYTDKRPYHSVLLYVTP